VMAALAGVGVDDALVEVDGPEVPVLDGSAAEFGFLISCAGLAETEVARDYIEVLRPVRVDDGAAFAELRPEPFAPETFSMTLAIEFPARAIGRQSLSLDLTPDSFARDLSRARTFTMASEIEALHQAGLALGGSLANAVVVDDDKVLNPEGLRFADEFVRHKLLDVVGDLALAGAPIAGRFIGNRSGHRLNNLLLRALFADPANYRHWQAPAETYEAVAA
jgi:UDP-3-O-[3-hydroxymyristoyl] N-acetylglucosamine deacetylase